MAHPAVAAAGCLAMEIGIDSFAAFASRDGGPERLSGSDSLNLLLDRIELAEQVGLDVFGIGEHHRQEFLDSAPAVVLAAAAARTKKIRLTSAVTVLSAADPVRAFQNFATLDLISGGRAEMVVGRGSAIEAFPLFGYDLNQYDALFAEHLDLLLQVRKQERVHWTGRFRPPLTGQGVYPRPVQAQLPIWLGVGGTPASFARAGTLGLPLMVAIIGGEMARFRPFIDLYREAGKRAGHASSTLKVGLHCLGFVATEKGRAADEFYPGYAHWVNTLGRERGWPRASRGDFDVQCAPSGAFLIGTPEEVAAKLQHADKTLGGISRVTFQMDNQLLTHAQLSSAIETIGIGVKPLLGGPRRAA